METTNDIMREMRNPKSNCPEDEKYEVAYSVADLKSILKNYADRIETAHKRELEAAIAATVKSAAQSASEVYEPHIQSEPVGNSAKMREALTKVKEWMERRIATRGFETSATFPTMLEDVVLPALSAPPRNCDKFNNYVDAFEAFEKQLRIEGKLGFIISLTEVINWIFAEAKGETK